MSDLHHKNALEAEWAELSDQLWKVIEPVQNANCLATMAMALTLYWIDEATEDVPPDERKAARERAWQWLQRCVDSALAAGDREPAEALH